MIEIGENLQDLINNTIGFIFIISCMWVIYK